MTAEKAGQKNEREEKCAVMGCCSQQSFAEMMAQCGKEMKGGDAMMQEMTKGGCCQPEEK